MVRKTLQVYRCTPIVKPIQNVIYACSAVCTLDLTESTTDATRSGRAMCLFFQTFTVAIQRLAYYALLVPKTTITTLYSMNKRLQVRIINNEIEIIKQIYIFYK